MDANGFGLNNCLSCSLSCVPAFSSAGTGLTQDLRREMGKTKHNYALCRRPRRSGAGDPHFEALIGVRPPIDVEHELMKTTLKIPDPIFHRAKARAAASGIPLRQFITEAVKTKLETAPALALEKPWMRGAGALKHLRKETARIQKLIDAEFRHVEQGRSPDRRQDRPS